MRLYFRGHQKGTQLFRRNTRHYPPAVSPDGGWLLFGSDRTGTMQIHVARIDGSDAAVVTAAPPGWSAMHGWWQPVAAGK